MTGRCAGIHIIESDDRCDRGRAGEGGRRKRWWWGGGEGGGEDGAAHLLRVGGGDGRPDGSAPLSRPDSGDAGGTFNERGALLN